MHADDILSDVLRLVRLKGCVYFRHSFAAPWAMQVDQGAAAQFHVVARGSCVVEAGCGLYRAAPGDVFVFPRGAPHTIGDRSGRQPLPGREAVGAIMNGGAPFAGEGVETQLVCGHFDYRHAIRHPLFAELPDVMHFRADDFGTPEIVDPIVPILLREMAANRPGKETVVERLAEAMLVQLLRAHVLRETPEAGFLAALSDRQLCLAIRTIQQGVASRLTLEDIAHAAGMSRSALAERFKAAMGCAPIEYLALWRMYTACNLLSDTHASVAEVASQVGYESDIAFARAFKRGVGTSPAEFRRAGLAGPG